MNNISEYINFKKGLDLVKVQLPGKEYAPLKKRLMKILGVETEASLSRHANAISKTAYSKQVKIGNEFIKLGITNYKGKTRKRAKQIA